MSTQTQNQLPAENHRSGSDTVIGLAVLGCLIAGGVGICKAMGMTSGFDVLLCLLGSVAAFGTVFHFCFRKE